jgi:ABC-type transport system involved in multi-copper enzyme maturation permease subunit
MTEIEMTGDGLPATDPDPGVPVVAPQPVRRRAGNPLRTIAAGIDGITAVWVKELRGRVRGRRAFVILTVYLLFLAGFAWAWELVSERAYAANTFGSNAAAFASSQVGQEVFGALVIVETLLVVFLAPASTAGAISLEREKQTLDLLAVTPISSLAIVIGKLLSALAYVFLLIAASIPLTAIVFVFGGVAPDDVVRAYVVLLVSTIGLGSLGLFISAVAQRTQGATVVTFFAVLALSLGTMFAVLFWNTMAGTRPGRPIAVPGVATDGTGAVVDGSISAVESTPGQPAEALLWFNPFAAQYDVICGASDGYGGWCRRLNTVTNGAITVGAGGQNPAVLQTMGAGVGIDLPANLAEDQAAALKLRLNAAAAANAAGGNVFVVNGQVQAGAPDAPVNEVQAFGPQRDTFWPHSVIAWAVASVVLILLSVQLVSPTRRWRLPSLRGRGRPGVR